MIEQRHKGHEPVPVHVLRDFRRIVDGKALTAHPENQVEFLSSGSPVSVQHGNSVEQMLGCSLDTKLVAVAILGWELARLMRPRRSLAS